MAPLLPPILVNPFLMQNPTNELVSIIIPAFNAAAFIEETIQSICRQTCQSWEIIIVNDGSTDNTAEISKAFKDPRIQCITQKNTGVAAARNKGLFFAKGEVIV